jgi:uncharacterized Ntn-hydrolase superfamily protein
LQRVTFSIAAWDPSSPAGPEWGVAVASKFLAVGSLVPWARANAGAIATQAFAKVTYGSEGLARLARGEDADAVVRALTEADEGRAQRQLGVVDARGRATTFTGDECMDWAGGRAGDGYCCQGNILAGAEVVDAIAASFESPDGDLATRLVRALQAGDNAGGDRRGRQSAALVVVREAGGYLGETDRTLDLRVDDHPDPVPELSRLLDLHRLYFPRPETLEFVPVDEALAAEVRSLLARRDYPAGTGPGYDEALRDALFAYMGTENLEERWSDDPVIEGVVLDHLRRSGG